MRRCVQGSTRGREEWEVPEGGPSLHDPGLQLAASSLQLGWQPGPMCPTLAGITGAAALDGIWAAASLAATCSGTETTSVWTWTLKVV